MDVADRESLRDGVDKVNDLEAKKSKEDLEVADALTKSALKLDGSKGNKNAIMARRRAVWEYIIRGVSEAKIAKAFGVHRNTIVNDVKHLREDMKSHVEELDQNAEIGEAIRFYDTISMKALYDYSIIAKDSPLKGTFLDKALKAQNQKIQLMLDTGLLQKAPQKIAGLFAVAGVDGKEVDINKASLEDLFPVLENLVRESMELKAQIEGVGSDEDVIDVDVKALEAE